MADTKSLSESARSRSSRSRSEWSCCVCTLLNNWRERRCGACDTERPADVESQPSEWSCDVCTLVNDWTALRCVACEHERPASTTSDANHSDCLRLDAPTPAPLSSSFGTDERSWTEVGERISPRSSRKRQRTPTKQRVSNTDVAISERLLSPAVLAGDTKTTAEEAVGLRDDVRDTFASQSDDLPEAPTFNLLSFVNNPIGSAEPTTTRQRLHEGDSSPQDAPFVGGPRFNLLEGATVDLTDAAADDRQLSESESRLVEAGLRLSDSESEDDKEDHGRSKRVLHRRLTAQRTSSPFSTSRPTAEPLLGSHKEWECPVCTNFNTAGSVQCELCITTRHRSGASEKQPNNRTTENACAVCTHLNTARASMCELCGSKLQTTSEATFTCVVCTNVNLGHLDQCELCETKRKSIACPVCTSLNDISKKRCEVCESILGERGTPEHLRPTRNEFTDLNTREHDDVDDVPADRYRANSFDSDSRADHESVGDFEDNFTNPYGRYPTSPPPQTRTTKARDEFQYRDHVEDISDNETYSRQSTTNQPPPSRRPELREFQHFLTVDDARLDYQCQIDYRSMFAESSRSRSYADRLQKRRRESQKRKRSALDNALGGQSPKGSSAKAGGKKKKAAKPGGKKAKAAVRRASTGRSAAKSVKKPKGTAKARRSSAPARSGTAGGINHYDTLGEDIGDDVTTMSWEGVGSAGYF